MKPLPTLHLKRLYRRAAALLAGLVVAGSALADTYEVKLPPELATSPKMCDYAPCKDVMPGATSFSERKGQPPYVEAYAGEGGQKKLVGYVMLSTDITDTPAYSGKPVVTLIGMDTAGKFSGVKILKHSEPILLLGIPESALIKFNNQYLGKFVGDNIEIGKSRPEENLIGLDAITGATVTVIAQNQVMMLSGGEVAKQVGILKPVIRPQAKFPPATTTPSWAQLVEDGSVQRLTVKPEEVGLKNDGRPYMDLWFGYLNQPTVGQAILGKDGYASLMGRLKDQEMLAVGWGATVMGTLQRLARTLSYRDISLVSLTGGVSAYIEGVASGRSSQNVHLIPAPLVVSQESIAEAIRGERHVVEVMSMARTANYALVGIGAVADEATLIASGYASRSQFEIFRRQGAVGDIIGIFYDQNGDDDAISNSFIKKAKKQSAKAAKTIKLNLNQVHNFIHSDNCMVCDILEYQGQHEVKTCKRCTVCAQKRRNSR